MDFASNRYIECETIMNLRGKYPAHYLVFEPLVLSLIELHVAIQNRLPFTFVQNMLSCNRHNRA